jgi:hypothetical protein
MKAYVCDGFTREVTREDLKPGNVIRMLNTAGSQAPFSDCVILHVEGSLVDLARPMAWADMTGRFTTHVETFAVYDSRIVQSAQWALVLLASGEPYTMQAPKPAVI